MKNLQRTFTGAPILKHVVLVLFILLCFTVTQKPVLGEVSNEDCLGCHSNKELEAETERGKSLTLFVPEDALKGSVHQDLSCVDCHKAATKDAFEEVPHGKTPLGYKCGECHEDTHEGFLKDDTHGRSFSEGNPRAPYCNGCHGGHAIMAIDSADSIMSKKHQSETCGKCHGQEKLNLEDNITKRNLIDRFKQSVHYKAIMENKNGAACTDCHSHHNILTSASTNSTVARTTITAVCAKCHMEKVQAYSSGPHGRSLKHGNNDVPNCTTCHGDHDMASLQDRTGDAKQWASTQVCIWCHNNERMMARYGLDTIPVQSYMNDFHGLTQRGSMGASATCADCHDPHHSLPSSHPGSRMHISNRGTTCGQCHGKVADSFSLSFSHRKAMEKPGSKIEHYVRIIYIFIILASVGGMFGYNFLIWLYAVRQKFLKQRKEKHVNRMSRYERASHFILIATFATLAITGFALKFPGAFWSKWLFAIGMTESVRAGIHRFAASLMTLDLIFFTLYMFFQKRGKCLLWEILPKKRDFTDFYKALMFYLGRSKEKHEPRFGVFNFGEKFEFWALMWGTIVMLVSGVILWLPKMLPAEWPEWIIPVSRAIHFYEAVLATLAIIIWHIFHVMFHPAEFPMNTSWITGYITEKEAKHRFEDDAIEKMQRAVTPKEQTNDNESEIKS